ncbi:MAG: YjgP/YjgQ family permease [Nitrospinaceae bacterium]|nr:YjgP/YjgQ family permease [Nitrospinaceae bacterium]MBT3435156.1 YjgP/YjgQ family permease [Nitrospinaceae bacterium]MBT3822901.1 YjgP/YjgQ family permease [Nitrospinaceae bacterium]MBT4092596.1 YjgP/YjgQ family permease [Nitrospinaceae bacterium]MBT4431049.1 YjgP/YjgQ family permease [Nitrospinaceae bacterium]
MKKLHRYILWEIISYFLLCIFLLTFLLLLNRMVQLTDLVINKGVPIATVGQLLLTILPVLMLVTLPMSTLVSSILAFSRLSNDSEFVAMTASGMSLYSQLVPVAIVGLLSAIISALLMMFGLPWSHQATVDLRYQILKNQASAFEIREQVFNDTFDGLIIYIRKSSRESKIMHGILISDSRDNRNTQVIFAEQGIVIRDPVGKRMILRLVNGTTHQVNAVTDEKKKNARPSAAGQSAPLLDPKTSLSENQYQVVRFGTYDLNLNLTQSLGNGKALRIRLRGLPISELRKKITAAKPGSGRYYSFLVEFHQRFATPFACLALALLGAPLGVQNRRSGRHGGFALSLIVVFAYYIISSFTEGLGESGTIPAIVAAWGPITLLLAVAAGAGQMVIRKGAVDIFGFLLKLAGRLPISDWLNPKTA